MLEAHEKEIGGERLQEMIETPHNYWLWVTTRETAAGADLNEYRDATWTWTCDEKTKNGDLILLYLNSKGKAEKGYHKSAFCYLIQAIGDAGSIDDDPIWRERGWKYGCDCQVLYAFKNPVRYKDLEQDSELKEWEAYKRHNFQGRCFDIPENIWNKLDRMASEINPDYPGYRKLIEMPEESLSSIESTVDADLDSILEEEELFEGKKVQKFTNYYERNSKLRSKAILFHGFKCMACDFDFEQKYGERGSKYIEVHHLNPVSSLEKETRIDPEIEMAVVCSNCHRMIHRRKDDVLSLEELRKIIRVK
ncbi:MAG: EVE domain-containing protein [Methanotrichaceae archaeon]|nr:EVE domain-containing protein [Methanotrichaceae archaeon]